LTEKVRVIECRDRLQWILQCYRSVCPNSWGGWRHSMMHITVNT
jgi:hypothetical protein